MIDEETIDRMRRQVCGSTEANEFCDAVEALQKRLAWLLPLPAGSEREPTLPIELCAECDLPLQGEPRVRYDGRKCHHSLRGCSIAQQRANRELRGKLDRIATGVRDVINTYSTVAMMPIARNKLRELLEG